MKNVILTLVLVASSALAEEPRLAPNAPVDRPTRVGTPEIDRRVAPFVAQAKKTWPNAKKRYLAGLPKGEIFFVTVQLREGDKMEQCFVRVKKFEGSKISATVASEIIALKKVHNGDPVTIDESELIDWMIAKPDGSEEGNFVGKFLDSNQP
jgi:uncharacterized protein YegJ (DUF2314 family)